MVFDTRCCRSSCAAVHKCVLDLTDCRIDQEKFLKQSAVMKELSNDRR